ncbi:NAD(P)H-hydrate dehydratase [Oleiharenicola sp. Vm1]|uniref:NAD(P)H-hydrate dehydratase n=1 Tax=Oleiharenicola sp. Vm1 TaxID=3398393 RepID=UPI0039F581DC
MPATNSHPILSCAEAKAWEARLLRDEAAEWNAMQRAGRAIANAILDDAREIGGLDAGARLLVLAGKGHNGGDALLAAAMLLAELPGATADVVLVFGLAALRPLARRALDTLRTTGGARVRELDAPTLRRELASYDACLDGVFGFQFRPPVDEAVAELLAWVNTHPRLRVRAAVDLPSGLGAEANGGTVFRADFTYCTGIVKAPVVAPANAAFVGRLRYLDLGFFASHVPESADRVLLPSLLRPLGALRPAQSDKRTFGHLVVVGGSRSYPGAVLMTVQAALRSGVGLLTACVPASLVPEYAAKFPEAMWVGFPESASGGLAPSAVDLVLEKAARASALVLGPGLGAAPDTLGAAEEIGRRVADSLPLLLDADALRPEVVRAAAGRRLVATPHAGEWPRIAAAWPAEGVLVAKGSPTRVVAGGAAFFSFLGGPVLARGGSGDLLAGVIGGLMAQGPDDLRLAATRGVVWHGLAADLLARDKGQVAVQTTQLLDYLQPALHCTDHEDT